jgi:hypothetical protein
LPSHPPACCAWVPVPESTRHWRWHFFDEDRRNLRNPRGLSQDLGLSSKNRACDLAAGTASLEDQQGAHRAQLCEIIKEAIASVIRLRSKSRSNPSSILPWMLQTATGSLILRCGGCNAGVGAVTCCCSPASHHCQVSAEHAATTRTEPMPAPVRQAAQLCLQVPSLTSHIVCLLTVEVRSPRLPSPACLPQRLQPQVQPTCQQRLW